MKEFNVDSKAACDELNLAHETETNNLRCQLVQYRLKIHEGRPKGIRVTIGKDSWKR